MTPAQIILAEVAEKHGVAVKDIRSRSRRHPVLAARTEAIRRLSDERKLAIGQIANVVGCTRRTAWYALRPAEYREAKRIACREYHRDIRAGQREVKGPKGWNMRGDSDQRPPPYNRGTGAAAEGRA